MKPAYQFGVRFIAPCLPIWRIKLPTNLAYRKSVDLPIWRIKLPTNLAYRKSVDLPIWRIKLPTNLAYIFFKRVIETALFQ